jgi:hypothetical protein
MKDIVPKVMLAVSSLVLAFGYGVVSAHYELFPYPTVREAFIAAKALRELRKDDPKFKTVEFYDEGRSGGPVYSKLIDRSGDEPVLVLGGNGRTYHDAATGQSYLAWIASRDGTIIHAWKDPGEIWTREGYEAVGDNWASYPVGAHVDPNGDLFVSYQGVGTYPYVVGLAKFDRDSNLLWKNQGLMHHWFSVAPDGKIYIPARKGTTSPLRLPDYEKSFVCDDQKFGYDWIIVVGPDGKTVRELSMLDSLIKSDLLGLYTVAGEQADVIETCDPTHLNDVSMLTPEMAPQYPSFQAGDLLISLRSLNTIGVIDPETGVFKWHFQGPAHQQHSPRFVGNNRIAYLDNLGGTVSRGTSRLLTVDVGTSSVETVFPRSGTPLPETTFKTKNAGHIDTSPAGDRLLASWTRQGLVWEIDMATGEVLWELVNTHPVDDRSARISVYTAKYVPSIGFPTNGGRFRPSK